MSRTSKTLKVTPAGPGADGSLYGVVSVETAPHGKRKAIRAKPCQTCPWRKDAPIGAFPAEAYRISASTCYDAAMSVFSCHESGTDKPATCAGFMLANSEHNLAVRLGLSNGSVDPVAYDNPEGVTLYEDYRAMAIANGVAEDDPAIAPCRGDMECFSAVNERIRQTGV